ncbi:MAG: Uma2 family endonuclease [Syntrophobacteraceae bacterium]|jgi:Uma2 family endonuclease
MSEPAKKRATYQDLYSVPENMIGEIIDGELIVTPRPARKHAFTATALDHQVGPPYQRGRGGPGGWIFIVEPEVGFGENTMVPDLAGWKAERFPWEEDHNWIGVVPDWVCEILSPGTFRLDRTSKMTTYAKYEVGHAWLIDPIAAILEVYRLESGRWSLLGAFGGEEKVCVEPFQEIEIDLGDLWPKAG